jgi:hypothetical protein
VVPFTVFTVLYLVLAVVVFVLMRRHVFAAPASTAVPEKEQRSAGGAA